MSLGDFVGTVRADFKRRHGMLGFLVVLTFRVGQLSYRARTPLRWLARCVHAPTDLIFVRLTIGSEIPRSIPCGEGLSLPHGGRMVIINPGVTLGANVTIMHGVTIGNAFPRRECPLIADRVFIGAQSTIIGGITIGERAMIGAHSLVRATVSPGEVVAGVPARVVGARPLTPDAGR